MKRMQKKGQSILEYTLILGVVIGIVVVAVFGRGGTGGMKGSIDATYNKSATAINKTVGELTKGVFQP